MIKSITDNHKQWQQQRQNADKSDVHNITKLLLRSPDGATRSASHHDYKSTNHKPVIYVSSLAAYYQRTNKYYNYKYMYRDYSACSHALFCSCRPHPHNCHRFHSLSTLTLKTWRISEATFSTSQHIKDFLLNFFQHKCKKLHSSLGLFHIFAVQQFCSNNIIMNLFNSWIM